MCITFSFFPINYLRNFEAMLYLNCSEEITHCNIAMDRCWASTGLALPRGDGVVPPLCATDDQLGFRCDAPERTLPSSALFSDASLPEASASSEEAVPIHLDSSPTAVTVESSESRPLLISSAQRYKCRGTTEQSVHALTDPSSPVRAVSSVVSPILAIHKYVDVKRAGASLTPDRSSRVVSRESVPERGRGTTATG